jgi:tripartite-type tricarboxylate transporter receptor subunit TctC
MKKTIASIFLSSITLLAGPLAAHAEDTFPSHPLKLLVPFSAGGPTDTMARLVATYLSDRLGQGVLVMNKPGGDYMVAVREMQASPADGYTLLFGTNGLFSVGPAFYEKYPLDTLNDLAYIGGISSYPYMFVTSANESRSTFQDFIAADKANPGSVTYAIDGNVLEVSGALLSKSTGTKMLPIRYKGHSDTISDLISQRLNLGAFAPSFAGSLVQGKKLKPLAVTGTKRLANYPDVPLASEVDPNLKEFSSSAVVWTGIVVPASTPVAVQQRLESTLKNVVNDPGFVKKVDTIGDIVEWRSAKDARARAEHELGVWRQIVQDANLTKR